MPNYQKTTIIGHLGKDPEIRYLPSGESVANFSVAVTETWKSKDGDKKETTTWYRCSAFGKLADVCGQYLKKGNPVFCDGKMQSRKWEDKEGVERESWELRVEALQLLGGKPTEAKPREQSKPTKSEHEMDDDIPF